MTKLERKYLRSFWLFFNDNYNLYKTLTTSEMVEILKIMKIYHRVVAEVLALGDEQDEYELKEIFEENNIEILK